MVFDAMQLMRNKTPIAYVNDQELNNSNLVENTLQIKILMRGTLHMVPCGHVNEHLVLI